jgi:phospholipid/cholesterol/gamma-HCH transport system ATP-binding protein
LIKIIAGLLKADAGSIKVLGREVTDISARELDSLRLKIGFSFQNSALYDSMTVAENLEFPLVRHSENLSREEINERVKTVLDAVGLLQAIHQMPSQLSGGQRKGLV